VRWLARAGADWRLLPTNFPPWHAVYQQWRRWRKAGCFEAIVHDLRVLLRQAKGRNPDPSAALFDSRTLRSSPESGARAGYDGPNKTRGSKLHVSVDTLGNLLAALVTPADQQDRDQVAALTDAVQEATGYAVEVAFVDQGYTGQAAADVAEVVGIQLEVVKFPEAKRGFILLPRRWVVERSFAWVARFKRLARDYERLPETLVSMHFLVFAILMLARAAPILPGA
jgi:transposase